MEPPSETSCSGCRPGASDLRRVKAKVAGAPLPPVPLLTVRLPGSRSKDRSPRIRASPPRTTSRARPERALPPPRRGEAGPGSTCHRACRTERTVRRTKPGPRRQRPWSLDSTRNHREGGREARAKCSDEHRLTVLEEELPRSDGYPWEKNEIAGLRGMSGRFSKRLHKLLRSESANPPESKSDLLPALSRMIKTRDEVPEQLQNVYDDLVRIAGAR